MEESTRQKGEGSEGNTCTAQPRVFQLWSTTSLAQDNGALLVSDQGTGTSSIPQELGDDSRADAAVPA